MLCPFACNLQACGSVFMLGWTAAWYCQCKPSLHTLPPLAHPQVDDAPDAQPLQLREGRVDFCNVSFGYTPILPPVLRGISFALAGGRSLGLVGATGSGKSTTLRLLLRSDCSAGWRLAAELPLWP